MHNQRSEGKERKANNDLELKSLNMMKIVLKAGKKYNEENDASVELIKSVFKKQSCRFFMLCLYASDVASLQHSLCYIE